SFDELAFGEESHGIVARHDWAAMIGILQELAHGFLTAEVIDAAAMFDSELRLASNPSSLCPKCHRAIAVKRDRGCFACCGRWLVSLCGRWLVGTGAGIAGAE